MCTNNPTNLFESRLLIREFFLTNNFVLFLFLVTPMLAPMQSRQAVGGCDFGIAGPKASNKLPNSLRWISILVKFRTNVKTYPFSIFKSEYELTLKAFSLVVFNTDLSHFQH